MQNAESLIRDQIRQFYGGASRSNSGALTTHLLTLSDVLRYDPGCVTSAELKRWLEQQGCTFEPGKGSHLKVWARHRIPGLSIEKKKELGKGLESAIKKQLGLK